MAAVITTEDLRIIAQSPNIIIHQTRTNNKQKLFFFRFICSIFSPLFYLNSWIIGFNEWMVSKATQCFGYDCVQFPLFYCKKKQPIETWFLLFKDLYWSAWNRKSPSAKLKILWLILWAKRLYKKYFFFAHRFHFCAIWRFW